jgi:tetratricopeptide (TPR) repeat protein
LNPPRWDEAIAFRRIAVAVRPQSSTANFYLGFSLHTIGKLDDATDYYRTALELDASNAPAQFCLANILRVRGKPEEALVRFQISCDLLPTDPNPLNGLAWELATCAEPRFRAPADAVALAQKVVDLSLKQGDDRDKPGRDRLGNYWKSLDIADGGDGRYVCEDWYFLAMVNWKLGRKDEAREWYDRAVEWTVKRAPNDEELRRFRAEAAALVGVERKG